MDLNYSEWKTLVEKPESDQAIHIRNKVRIMIEVESCAGFYNLTHKRIDRDEISRLENFWIIFH